MGAMKLNWNLRQVVNSPSPAGWKCLEEPKSWSIYIKWVVFVGLEE